MAENKKRKKKRRKGKHRQATPAKRGMRMMNIIALALMLAALFGYLATLDESDPEALPVAAGAMSDDAP